MRGEIEGEVFKRVILRAVQDRGAMLLGKLTAGLGLTIVVTLCVYYPCQDAVVQRRAFAEENFSQQRVQTDFEELISRS
jgi:hypothetical protein